jgi:hypothetical protein
MPKHCEGRAACLRSHPGTSRERPGRGQPRRRAGAAPSRSCERRKPAGSRCGRSRTRRAARVGEPAARRLPGSARVLRRHRSLWLHRPDEAASASAGLPRGASARHALLGGSSTNTRQPRDNRPCRWPSFSNPTRPGAVAWLRREPAPGSRRDGGGGGCCLSGGAIGRGSSPPSGWVYPNRRGQSSWLGAGVPCVYDRVVFSGLKVRTPRANLALARPLHTVVSDMSERRSRADVRPR